MASNYPNQDPNPLKQSTTDSIATASEDNRGRDVSRLSIYSIGIVAANKELQSREIEVTPIEQMPMLNGELNDNVSSLETKGTTADGSSYESKLNATNSIRAQWLPIGMSNRVTPPDVRRGEHVAIYKYGDHDKYYWTTLQDDLHLRKLETVVYAWSNTREESQTTSPDNTYFLEVSTHKKIVHLHTAANDGELCTYDIQINTKEGYVAMVDGLGNVFRLNSKAQTFIMENPSGNYFKLEKDNLNIKLNGSMNIEASGGYNLKTPTINEQGERTLQGNQTNSGTTTTKGISTGSGGGSFGGTVTSSGNMYASKFIER